MSKPVKNFSIYEYKQGHVSEETGSVVVEDSISLSVNGNIWLTFMCTPTDLEPLGIGFLFNEGVIDSPGDIKDIRLAGKDKLIDVWLHFDAEQPMQWKRTSGCTGGYSAVSKEHLETQADFDWGLSPEWISKEISSFLTGQNLYQQARGIHAAGIATPERGLLLAVEDIGRHNAIDKAAGLYLQKGQSHKNLIIFSTGRISSEMLYKAGRLEVGVVISRTSPTSMSIEMAESLGITLIGYARGPQFTIYTHPKRISLGAL
jgi:FdhD protein